jgi:uncharacterized paraquat-inducible protein A
MKQVTCQHCGKRATVPTELEGRYVYCPRCKTVLLSPGIPAAPCDAAAEPASEEWH